MNLLKRLFASRETRSARPERSATLPVRTDGESQELSETDLEEVLGGLERIHLPATLEVSELES